MKPFHTIAVPHTDILEGKLTMDIFAADLWETHVGRAAAEYKDPDLFFKKTYMTEDLRKLVSVVKKRIVGKGGDPVIKIQTPFGGGKTHTLITLYHNAKRWNVKTVVLSGSSMSTTETLWGSIEMQLTGKTDRLVGNIAPGREALRSLLEQNQPVVILIDELLDYTARAGGVPIEDTTLAAQTMAFMQELTEVPGILEKVCVVFTLLTGGIEQYDKNAEKISNMLQKITGRVQKIYSPVRDSDIAQVIRRRLFSNIELKNCESNIHEFLEYVEREGILPVGTELSRYKEKFLDSYPFLPDVIETLYHKWGSLYAFQRTRGVLRLLSLIIYNLRNSSRTYISLADFDLSDDEIRRELVEYIGNEFDSVISADITDSDSGSKKVDESLGKSYQGLKIGTRTATSIFMYSFSGGVERGCHLEEIKRSATTTDIPSSVVAEAVERLKSNLFFLQNVNDKYLFANQPNLNRIILTKIENIQDDEVIDLESSLLKKQLVGDKFKIYLWPIKVGDIRDTQELKLVLLREKNDKLMKNIIETKGEGSPRIYRNTIFFLTPLEAEKPSFLEVIKKRIAYEQIDADKTLNLNDDQRTQIKDILKKDVDLLNDAARGLYRLICIPIREGFREADLGIPTYGEEKSIDQDVYDKLRDEEEILEDISPMVIKERYLENKDYLEIHQIYDSMLKTPGQSRVTISAIVEKAIRIGVKQGKFGLGEIDNTGKVVCRLFQQDVPQSIDDMEVIVSDKLCSSQIQTGIMGDQELRPMDQMKMVEPSPQLPTDRGTPSEGKIMTEVNLKFKIPRGKVSQIYGAMNFLQSRFQSLEIEIKATNGNMSDDDFANKIKETLLQLGIELESS